VVFHSNWEMMELNFHLHVISSRFMNLERCSFDLDSIGHRGIAPEDIANKAIFLDLVDGELTSIERQIERCRNIIRQVLKEVGYEDFPLPYNPDDGTL